MMAKKVIYEEDGHRIEFLLEESMTKPVRDHWERVKTHESVTIGPYPLRVSGPEAEKPSVRTDVVKQITVDGVRVTVERILEPHECERR
jgi:hypothetical protein